MCQTVQHLIERLLENLMSEFVPPEATTTVLWDWTKGRRSEVDDLNGLVVIQLKLARKCPGQSDVVQIAHQIERRRIAPGVRNMSLLLDQARSE